MFLLFISFIYGIICLHSSCDDNNGFSDDPSPVDSMLFYNINVHDLIVRDPFIFLDTSTNSYYLHVNNRPHIRVYRSFDLVKWKDEGYSFTATPDFWGQNDFWAPDIILWEGNYYLLVTFSSSTHNRGTSILVSDKPGSGFTPLVNGPITPTEWMCLDATIHIDRNNDPWLVFCREWLEVIDGEIYAQRLSSDFSETIGDPILLFSASEAPWTGTISHSSTSGTVEGYVTDAPFLHFLDDGTLIMLWSSFTKEGKYAIGIAQSLSGTIEGPWVQETNPINDDNGGHAMLFRSHDDRLMISYHAPNVHPSRVIIKEVYENDSTIIIP